MDKHMQVSAATALILLALSVAAQAANVPHVSGGAGLNEREELLATGEGI